MQGHRNLPIYFLANSALGIEGLIQWANWEI